MRPAAGIGPDEHRAAQVRGSCASANRAAPMWSAAVLDPAFPGRSTIARGSPVPGLPVVGPGGHRMMTDSPLPRSKALSRRTNGFR